MVVRDWDPLEPLNFSGFFTLNSLRFSALAGAGRSCFYKYYLNLLSNEIIDK